MITAILLRLDGVFGSADIEAKIISGCAGFLDVGMLIVLALALGKLTQDLGTGPFVAQVLSSSLPIALIPAHLPPRRNRRACTHRSASSVSRDP